MLNEEKIKLMAKASLFAQKEKKYSLHSGVYFRGDYISIGIIKAALSMTISYIFIFLIWALYHTEELLIQITYEELVSIGIKFLIGYVIVLVIDVVLAFIIYRRRYNKEQKDLKEYLNTLKKIQKINRKEQKVKAGRRETTV